MTATSEQAETARSEAGGEERAADDPMAARSVAAALFDAGGPLAGYPGPALVVGAGAVVLAANRQAKPFVGTILAGLVEARPALESALSGVSAQVQPFLAPDAGGPTITLDLLLLPFAEANAALVLGRDVTLERALRAALVDSRQRYKELVEASSDFSWETGPEGVFTFVSPAGALGYAADDLIGRQAEAFLIRPEAEPPGGGAPFSTQDPVSGAETWFRAASGKPACLIAAARPLYDSAGRWCGARGVCRDVTEARAREADLARARQRERLLVYILRTVRHEVDPQSTVSAAASIALSTLNATGCRIYRLEVDGTFARAAEAGEPATLAEAAVLAALADGETLVERVATGGALVAVATSHRRTVNGALCLWRPGAQAGWDDDDRFLLRELADQLGVAIQQIADREALQTLSAVDPLTGLMNRRSFMGELERRFRAVAADGRTAALFYVDLDNFKEVNDRHGHAQGDAALVSVADLLRGSTRSRDLVGRIGGDEFVLWLEDIGEVAACVKAEELIGASAGLRRFCPDTRRRPGLSIGIALREPGSAEGLEAMIARADAAMYRAKRAGRSRYAVAEPAVRDTPVGRPHRAAVEVSP